MSAMNGKHHFVDQHNISIDAHLVLEIHSQHKCTSVMYKQRVKNTEMHRFGMQWQSANDCATSGRMPQALQISLRKYEVRRILWT